MGCLPAEGLCCVGGQRVLMDQRHLSHIYMCLEVVSASRHPGSTLVPEVLGSRRGTVCSLLMDLWSGGDTDT